MGDNYAIEWTDATWNSIAGCTRVTQDRMVQHWLLRKYVNKMNPPPVRPLPESEVLARKPFKTLRPPIACAN